MADSPTSSNPTEGLTMAIGRLDGEAQERVRLRTFVEERWLRDLRHYHGKYDEATQKALDADKKKSKLFIGLTRARTHTWAARLSDLLFPTDDRNWGIKPTPVPSLQNTGQGPEVEQRVKEANKALTQGDPGQAQQIVDQGNQEAGEQEEANKVMREARERAETMALVIDDQFREARYQAACEEVIEDAVKLGTGVLKGPLTRHRQKKNWVPQGGEGQALHVLDTTEIEQPDYVRVDPWNFFPDMDARTVDQYESTFERHPLNRRELRRLGRRRGFSKKVLRELLEQGAQGKAPNYVAHLRDVSENQGSINKSYFEVWEYHGPVNAQELRDLVEGSDEGADVYGLTEESHSTDEFEVVVFFCQNRLLKVGPHPLETEDCLYSVFNFEPEETGPFGFGVPAIMRDSQRAANASWRMMMENGGLSAGPQIVINKEVIVPADGSYDLTPKKVWLRKPGVSGAAFESYDIKNNQAEFANIIQMAIGFVDQEINMPLIAQGDQAAHITQTQGGMAMLMNAANVVFRRVVKAFDRDMTTPTVRRAYDWNMQNSEREDIKGDFEVVARGSSVLLVKDIQGQNLMTFMATFGNDPEISIGIRKTALARKILETHMLPPDEFFLSDAEIKTQQEDERAAAEGQPQEVLPEQIKLQIAQLDSETKLSIARLSHETAMMSLAEKQNIHLEDLRARMTDKQADRDSSERKLATEAALTPASTHGGGGTL